METTYINESEIRDRFVKECRSMSQGLKMAIIEKEKEYGIGIYVGGLHLPICSDGMDLETNIQNMLAAFSINYAESMFFQLDNINKMETLNIVQDFLIGLGLEDKFRIYKRMRQEKQYPPKPQSKANDKATLNLDAPVKAIPIP